jgi:hypothetical protein
MMTMLRLALLMPPWASTLFPRGALSQTAQDFATLRAQWNNPRDIVSILTVIGGDIVQGALAQLCSSNPPYFTPVAFSFGWVSYSFSAILSAIGSHRFAPQPDCPCTLIEVDMGYPRDVRSWVLSRLVRDYEFPGDKTPRGLTLSFYRTSPKKLMGVPDHDWVYYSGVMVIALQLGIAIIPGALFGNWVIFILTFGGVLLVQLQASLPQWRKELWMARPIEQGKHEVVCLTRGNGSSYVMVIRSDGCGRKMSDLAAGREVKEKTTVPATFLLAIMWLIHLFCMGGVANNSWYPLIIGALGMLQNALASGARRSPGALGIHLEEEVRVVHNDKVFKALMEAEEVEKRVGIVLIDVFFPGGLRPDEEAWKQEKLAQYAMEKQKKKQANEQEQRKALSSDPSPPIQGLNQPSQLTQAYVDTPVTT